MKCRLYLVIFVMMMFLSYSNVNASTASTYICFNNIRYQIDYDNSYVKKDDLSNLKENAQVFYVVGHENDDNYRIIAYNTGKSCYGKASASCPTGKDKSLFSTGEYANTNMEKNGNIKITYNESTGRIDIKLNSTLFNKYNIRFIQTSSENDNQWSRNIRGFEKDFYPNDQFLKSPNFSVSVGTRVFLEYYEKGGECDGVYISDQYYKMPDKDNVLINNPAVKNPNDASYKLCDAKVRKNKDLPSGDYPTITKKAVANYCYEEKIKLSDLSKIFNIVTEQTNKVVEILSPISDIDDSEVVSNVTEQNSNKTQCTEAKGITKCEDSITKTVTFQKYSNSNFSVNCTDTYTFHGDTPKLTYAGGGFEYGSKLGYSLTRTCSLSFHGTPATKPPQCSIYRTCVPGLSSCSPISHYDGADHESKDAGPNDEFDSCILMCDKGKYTQKCINSCYEQVYGTDTKRNNKMANMKLEKYNINSLLSYNSKKAKTVKVGVEGKNATSSATSQNTTSTELSNKGVIWHPPGTSLVETGADKTHLGNIGVGYKIVDSNGKTIATGVFSNYCSRTGAYTTWDCSVEVRTDDDGKTESCYDTVGPSGCSWTPNIDYCQALQGIYGDYNAALNQLASQITDGRVDINIVDSYLKNKDGSYYMFNINDKNSPIKLIKNVTKNSNSGSNGSASIGNSGDGCLPSSVDLRTYTQTITVDGIYIDATAYTNKLYGNIVYKKDNQFKQIVKKSNGVYDIYDYTNFDLDRFYISNHVNKEVIEKIPDASRYYTSLYTKNINLSSDSDITTKVSLIDRNNACYNIEVKVTGLGDSNKNYTFTNSCYYGVYNHAAIKKCNKPPCPSGDPAKGVSDTIIFRPIELSKDIFPDREPRWNWTDKARLNDDTVKNFNDKFLGYHVKASDTINHIATSKDTILNQDNGEIDYEIILTRENIARIKRYNKEQKSYTNFDLTCNVKNNDATFCKSNFLDNSEYIKNAGNVRKNAVIGTNND